MYVISKLPFRLIRPYAEADKAEVAGVWHRSGLAAYPYLPTWQTLSLEIATWVFENIILANNSIWVGTGDERIVAYMAMHESIIDRLYVDPPDWHKGWGTQLVKFAKQLSPAGLECFTHQENHPARAFYEHHSFITVRFGVSPLPESAPDVEYHWRP